MIIKECVPLKTKTKCTVQRYSTYAVEKIKSMNLWTLKKVKLWLKSSGIYNNKQGTEVMI